MRPTSLRLCELSLLLMWLASEAFAAPQEVTTRAGDAIPLQIHAATGERLLLWLPGEHGVSPRQFPTAQALAADGIEVWMPDLHSAWFLPQGRYSLLDVRPEVVADLIAHAATTTGKRIYVMAAGRSAALALAGIRVWQAETVHPEQLGGAVLLHPNLYRRTPQGGESAEYLPIAQASALPLYLFQPEQSAAFWRVGELVRRLETGGSTVFLHRLEAVSDGFNTRPDFEPREEALAARLPAMLAQALDLLAATQVTTVVTPAGRETLAAPERERRSALLRPYANPRPAPPLRLADLEGEVQDLASLSGRAVVVNFWATWCPPCVEEIPSLQRLYDRLRDEGLAVLTVDVGEAPEQVKRFLADKPVTFPVLLDPEGEAFKRWQAYAFPTTLILDRRHHIRYAVFGAFAWDSPEVVDSLRALLAE